METETIKLVLKNEKREGKIKAEGELGLPKMPKSEPKTFMVPALKKEKEKINEQKGDDENGNENSEEK